MNKFTLLMTGAAMALPMLGSAENQAIKVPTGTDQAYYRVEIAHNVSFEDVTNPVSTTMSGWIALDDMTRSSSNIPVMGHRAQDYDNDNGSFFVNCDASNTLGIYGKGINTAPNRSEALTPGQWYYVTISFDSDSNEFSLYIDGDLVTTTTGTDSWSLFQDTNKYMGNIMFFGHHFLGAAVDEINIYNRCLTAAEVATSMKTPEAVQGLVALYTFDEVAPETTSTFANLATGDAALTEYPAYLHSNLAPTPLWGSYQLSTSEETEPTFIEGRVLKQEYCNPLGDALSTYAGRYVSNIDMTDTRGNSGSIATGQTSKSAMYRDLTETTIGTFTAGQQVTVKTTGAGEWMHLYMFVDWNDDGIFDDTTENGVAVNGGELMTHNGLTYSDPGGGKLGWYNTEGVEINEPAGGYAATLPAFTIPADTKPGVYYARLRGAWSVFDPCSDLSQGANTMVAQGGLTFDFCFEVVKDAHAMRTITIKANDDDLGTVEFVGVEVEGNQLTSTDNVTVKATVTGENAYFVCWNNQDGEMVSTDAEYTYEGDDDLELTAVFREHFAVNFEGVKVSNDAGTITSGTIVDKGTQLIVEPIVPAGKLLSKLIVNEADVTPSMENGMYVFDVVAETNITAEFADMMSVVTVTVEGDGKVVIATENEEGTPAGTIVASGDEVAYNTTLYIFLYPEEGAKLLSAELDGYDWASDDYSSLDEVPDGYMFEYSTYAETFDVDVKFSVKEVESSIDMIAADEASAEYYNLQGVRVNRANMVPGVYVRRAADKVQKVIVK